MLQGERRPAPDPRPAKHSTRGHSRRGALALLPPPGRCQVLGGFRFYFFSNERHEPPHVHVRKGGGKAKFWLRPVALAVVRNMQGQEVSRARKTR
ncbi:MAG: DUF4160 domain-containing protein [Candidatus Binatia bacterium]